MHRTCVCTRIRSQYPKKATVAYALVHGSAHDGSAHDGSDHGNRDVTDHTEVIQRAAAKSHPAQPQLLKSTGPLARRAG